MCMPKHAMQYFIESWVLSNHIPNESQLKLKDYCVFFFEWNCSAACKYNDDYRYDGKMAGLHVSFAQEMAWSPVIKKIFKTISLGYDVLIT